MRTIIGVMGGGSATPAVTEQARTMGRLIAEAGWVLLNGGRDAGVMAASAAGAHEAGGLVVGVLQGTDLLGVAPDVDIAIPTGMGDARNAINVLASHVVVAFPGGAGTLSEIALALKSERPVITVGFPLGEEFQRCSRDGRLTEVSDPEAALALIHRIVDGRIQSMDS